jgi:hypothetical protein
MRGWAGRIVKIAGGLLVLFFVLMLFGNSTSPSPEISRAQSLAIARSTYADAIMSQVRGMMKNPHSVQFRNVRVVDGHQGKPVVCGYVNAHNAYGAYAGESRFVSAFGMVYVLSRDKPNTEGLSAWTDYCE